MSSRTHSAESTLVHGAAPKLDEAELARGLAACLKRRASAGVEVQTDHSPGIYIHFSMGQLDVLVSLCAMRLPSDHFAGAVRPPNRLRADGYVQSVLEFHDTCMTILVTSKNLRRDPVPPSRIDALCAAVTHHVARVTAPDLIYLGSSDMIYAQEEFARLDPAIRPAAAATEARMVRPAPIRVDYIHAKPQVPQTAEAWFLHGRGAPVRSAEEAPEIDLPSPEQLSTDLRDTPAGTAAIFVMNISVMILSFPIGYALLIYNIMSGGSFLATARALSVTGIVAAAATTGLPAQALALF